MADHTNQSILERLGLPFTGIGCSAVVDLNAITFSVTNLTASDCEAIMACIIEHGTPTQFTEILNRFDMTQLTPVQCQAIFACIITNGTTVQFTEFLQRLDFNQLTAAQCVVIFQCIIDNGTPAQITQLLQKFDFSQLTAAQCSAIFQCIIDNGTTTQFTEFLSKIDFSTLTAAQCLEIAKCVDYTNLTPEQCTEIFQCILDSGSTEQFTQLLQKFDMTQLTAVQCVAISQCLLDNLTTEQITQLNSLIEHPECEAFTIGQEVGPLTVEDGNFVKTTPAVTASNGPDGQITVVADASSNNDAGTMVWSFASPVTVEITRATQAHPLSAGVLAWHTSSSGAITPDTTAVRSDGVASYTAGVVDMSGSLVVSGGDVTSTSEVGYNHLADWGTVTLTDVTQVEFDYLANEAYTFKVTAADPIQIAAGTPCEQLQQLADAVANDKFARLVEAGAPFTDDAGNEVSVGDFYVLFPNGSRWKGGTSFDINNLTPAQCQSVFQCILDSGTAAQFTELLQKFDMTDLTDTQCDALANLLVSLDADNVITVGTDGKLYVSDSGTSVGGIVPIAGTNNIQLVDTNGDPIGNPVDLTAYLDDTNLARLVSGTVDAATGIMTVVRDDNSTFTIDLSALLGDMFGEVKTATAALTTTNGVAVAIGEEYIEFPAGTTWASVPHPVGSMAGCHVVAQVGGGVGSTLETFTPHVSGNYIFTQTVENITGSGGFSVGTTPQGTDVFNIPSTPERLNASQTEISFTIALTGGVEYHLWQWPGGGGTYFNARLTYVEESLSEYLEKIYANEDDIDQKTIAMGCASIGGSQRALDGTINADGVVVLADGTTITNSLLTPVMDAFGALYNVGTQPITIKFAGPVENPIVLINDIDAGGETVSAFTVDGIPTNPTLGSGAVATANAGQYITTPNNGTGQFIFSGLVSEITFVVNTPGGGWRFVGVDSDGGEAQTYTCRNLSTGAEETRFSKTHQVVAAGTETLCSIDVSQLPAEAFIDRFGTVASPNVAEVTTTNGVTVPLGGFYVQFPDGTSWATPDSGDAIKSVDRIDCYLVASGADVQQPANYDGPTGEFENQEISSAIPEATYIMTNPTAGTVSITALELELGDGNGPDMFSTISLDGVGSQQVHQNAGFVMQRFVLDAPVILAAGASVELKHIYVSGPDSGAIVDNDGTTHNWFPTDNNGLSIKIFSTPYEKRNVVVYCDGDTSICVNGEVSYNPDISGWGVYPPLDAGEVTSVKKLIDNEVPDRFTAAYANVGIGGTLPVQVLSTTGQRADFANRTVTLDLAQGVIIDASANELVVAKAGVYEINAHASVEGEAGSNPTILEMYIRADGTLQSTATQRVVASQRSALAATCLVQVPDGDAVTLSFGGPSTPLNQLRLTTWNLNVKRIA